MTNFGDFLRAQRIACDLSQRAVSEMLGAAPVTYRRWELGERRPDPDTLPALYEALRMGPAERAAADALYLGRAA